MIGVKISVEMKVRNIFNFPFFINFPINHLSSRNNNIPIIKWKYQFPDEM